MELFDTRIEWNVVEAWVLFAEMITPYVNELDESALYMN